MTVIEIKNLKCSIGGHDILHGVSLSVGKGEFLAIIGPNGAGKSTLLKCIGGLAASKGEILIDGQNIRRLSERERARRIAWLHQSGTDSLPYTVREFAMMSRYPWRSVLSAESEEDAQVVETSLKRADALQFSDRVLSTLSGGERQRALLAAALSQGTDILFLDEPTSFLDYRQQNEMTELILRLHNEGMTIIAVTHDINLALHSCSTAAALKNGRLVWRGKSTELINGAVLKEIYETDFELLSSNGTIYAVPKGNTAHE